MPTFTLFLGKEGGRARINRRPTSYSVWNSHWEEKKTSSEGSTLSRRGKTTHQRHKDTELHFQSPINGPQKRNRNTGPYQCELILINQWGADADVTILNKPFWAPYLEKTEGLGSLKESSLCEPYPHGRTATKKVFIAAVSSMLRAECWLYPFLI